MRAARATSLSVLAWLIACGGPAEPYPIEGVTLDPSPPVLDLGTVTYADSVFPSATVLLANGSQDTLYVTPGLPDGTEGADLLTASLDPYTTVLPAQRRALDVRLRTQFTSWSTGTYEVSFPYEITYFFFGQRPDQGGSIPVGGDAPTRTGEIVDVTVRFAIDCDLDDDGVDAAACGGADCDDANPSIRPGADELCSTASVDEDCDGGTLDNDAVDTVTWYRDLDNDGFGAGSETWVGCRRPGLNWADNNLDCDDGDVAEKPGGPEIACNDGKDNDCDGNTDAADADCAG